MCHAPSHFQFTSWLRWIAWETELCAPNFIPIEQRRQSQFLYSLHSAIAFKQFDALPGFVLKGRTGEAKNEFKKWLPSENRFVPRCQECNCDNILTPHKLRRRTRSRYLWPSIIHGSFAAQVGLLVESIDRPDDICSMNILWGKSVYSISPLILLPRPSDSINSDKRWKLKGPNCVSSTYLFEATLLYSK